MTAVKLPGIGDAPVRPRRSRSKPDAQTKTTTEAKVRKPRASKSIQVPDTPADAENAQAVQDLILNDQLERARQAREQAELTQSQPGVDAVQEPVPAEPVQVTQPQPQPQPQAPGGKAEYIVDDSLVNALRAVKTVSIPEFSEYLNELSTMIDLWRNAKSEAAKRRHLLSLLLLLQEKQG